VGHFNKRKIGLISKIHLQGQYFASKHGGKDNEKHRTECTPKQPVAESPKFNLASVKTPKLQNSQWQNSQNS
jgi:hypothetical protein